jgi:pyruvate-ferredoxin/flavodoxin oxidoreductase
LTGPKNRARGEPLYLDVKTAFYGKEWQPVIVGGRYGVGGKDIIPGHRRKCSTT